MELALLCLWGTLLALCPGALSLTQGPVLAASPSPGPRILSSSHRVPYPLYMMQLYRSFQTSHDRLSSQSDSVLSLMAQGEFKVGFFYLFVVFKVF